MTWIDLGTPAPKKQPDRYKPFEWSLGERIPLGIPSTLPSESLISVINNRRTQRDFSKVEHSTLGSMFWTIAREQQLGPDFAGYKLSLRPAPSAGAVHPIHILISDRKNNRMMRYNPTDHTMDTVSSLEPQLIEHVNKAVDMQNGELIILVAEPGKTQAIYHDADSLIWRDAGVLLGYFSMIAPLFNFNFCPLGLLGESFAKSLDKQGRLHGVGCALLGGRS